MKIYFIIFLLIMLLSGCASDDIAKKLPINDTTITLESTPIDRSISDNELRPGYTLFIRHSSDKKLSGSYKINWDGTLNLPYGKTLQTNDKSTDLLASELKNAYSDLFKSSNSFSVTITQKSLAIEVRGLIKKPGSMVIKSTTTLEEIITKSEIDREQADYARIELEGKSQWIDLKQYNSGLWPSDKMPKWAGGENIWFVSGDSNFSKGSADIRLMGEVNQPGTFSFQSGKSVLDYITFAGGLKSSANIEKIYIYRPVNNKQVVLDFSLLKPQNFQLAAGDTLLITNDRQDSTERRFQMGANLAAILSALGVLLIAL